MQESNLGKVPIEVPLIDKGAYGPGLMEVDHDVMAIPVDDQFGVMPAATAAAAYGPVAIQQQQQQVEPAWTAAAGAGQRRRWQQLAQC
uniref:Uncharacterized protein n=1 Tax=Tetradesmus obliquus TaxID=3088 RepID=A0A383WFN7_TETOB